MPRKLADESLDALLRSGDPAESALLESEKRWHQLQPRLTDATPALARSNHKRLPALVLLGATALVVGLGTTLWPRPAPAPLVAQITAPRTPKRQIALASTPKPEITPPVIAPVRQPARRKPARRVRARRQIARVARAEHLEPRRAVRRRSVRRPMRPRPLQNSEFVERIIIDCSARPAPTAAVAIIGTGDSLRVIQTSNSTEEKS